MLASTIFVNEVDDPSKYGVVIADENGRIKSFIEKPTQFVGNKINSGLYIFNTSIIDRIPVTPPLELAQTYFDRAGNLPNHG